MFFGAFLILDDIRKTLNEAVATTSTTTATTPVAKPDIDKRCPSCSAAIVEDDTFCGECGDKLKKSFEWK